MELQTILFWVLSVLGIAGGIGLILNRNPIYAALSLIVNFFCIAGLYLTLQSEFLAVIQVLVYAGAIMVLFLFVIMLLNLSDEPRRESIQWSTGIAYALGVAFVIEMLYIFHVLDTPVIDPGQTFHFDSVESIGALMMTRYLFPFEMISVVLLAALVGAIVIAKKWDYDKE